MKRKKIRVARDDVRGMTAYRKFEEFVVFRVTAGVDPDIDVNPFRFAC